MATDIAGDDDITQGAFTCFYKRFVHAAGFVFSVLIVFVCMAKLEVS